VRIREFQERDRSALVAMMDDFGDELAAMDPHRRVIRADGMGDRAVARMLDDSSANEGVVLVAEAESGIVGFAAGAVRTRDPDEELEVIDFRNGEVTELYVVPDARRGGVGRALLERLDEHFREVGCGAVRINVFGPNAGTRAFYRAMGYEERDLWVFRLLT
jgi:GNAT superfamily N-acetyltransferase